jgi:DNA recombination protein RmuC
MEPVLYLVILMIGYVAGAISAGFIFKSSRGPNLAASESEFAEMKAKLAEKDQSIGEARQSILNERDVQTRLQSELRTEAERRVAAEERSTRIPALESLLADKDRALVAVNQEVTELKARHASLLTRMDDSEKGAQEKLRAYEEAQQKMSEQFKVVAAEALAGNTQQFQEMAKETLVRLQEAARGETDEKGRNLDDVVRPLKESLERVDARIGEYEKERATAVGALAEQVKGLAGAQAQMQAEAAVLMRALRAPAVRGHWGEVQLRRVVELAGMLEYADFESGPATDLVVHLPNLRNIEVDARVPLAAYLEAHDIPDDQGRDEKLKEHAAGVRKHVEALAVRAQESGHDFTVAFVPAEAFLSAALSFDPGLLEDAVRQNVLLATPTSLIGLLKAVSYGWRQEKIARNAQQISDLGRELHDRIAGMAGYLDELRRGLERSVDAYNKTVGSLESRVLTPARRFKELGAASGEEIPAVDVVERAPRAVQAPELVYLAEAVQQEQRVEQQQEA